MRIGAVPFVVSRCTGDPVRVDTEVVVVFESVYGPNRAEIAGLVVLGIGVNRYPAWREEHGR